MLEGLLACVANLAEGRFDLFVRAIGDILERNLFVWRTPGMGEYCIGRQTLLIWELLQLQCTRVNEPHLQR